MDLRDMPLETASREELIEIAHDCRAALAATEMRAIESEKDAAAFLRSRDEAVARADEAERAVVRLWEYCDIHIDAEDYFSELAPLVARIRERVKP